MSTFIAKPLSLETWEAYADLIHRHNGVWGGCWCLGFHGKATGDYDKNREVKRQMVANGETHASLVFDGDLAIGWCQFGPTETLTKIKHRKRYEAELDKLPDWRITCFFVDKRYRGKGVSAVALAGAMEQIKAAGGGLVESYPENTEGRKTQGAFLYNTSLSTFEKQGFERIRQLGMHHWLVRKTV